MEGGEEEESVGGFSSPLKKDGGAGEGERDRENLAVAFSFSSVNEGRWRSD